MVLANSPWADESYHQLLAFNRSTKPGSLASLRITGETMSMLAFVNDALMAVFLFVIGLEIKQNWYLVS